MNKFFGLASAVAILLLAGAGCWQSGSNANTTANQAAQNQQTEKKPVTSKSSQERADEFKSILKKVFGGDVKLTSNATNALIAIKGVIDMTFSIGRNPVDADANSLISAFADLGYKKLGIETAEDQYYGRNSNISFSGSPYYLSIFYYNNEKQVNIMLMPTAEAEKLLKEE